MQSIINFIFVFAAVCIIVGSLWFAGKSGEDGSDYGVGWLWGLISGLCIWAL
jgi:hypothetical protein